MVVCVGSCLVIIMMFYLVVDCCVCFIRLVRVLFSSHCINIDCCIFTWHKLLSRLVLVLLC